MRGNMILDPGMNLTLRPMKYQPFYEMYRSAIKNTWTVEEVDLSSDVPDLLKLTDSEAHLIKRLVAFFATGDTIVSNNLVLNLYKHINSPEARMYLSRQLYEEALHVQFYLTLLDTYLEDPKDRAEAFKAIEDIPSIKQKGDFCFKWIDSINEIDVLDSKEKKKAFLLNLICFASCIEGLFFFAAFAYVYFLRSKGLLHGLATGTNWVFRDESCHMNLLWRSTPFEEEPDLFDKDLNIKIIKMIKKPSNGNDLCAGCLEPWSTRPLDERHAAIPSIHRRSKITKSWDFPDLQQFESVPVHGTPRRARAHKLF